MAGSSSSSGQSGNMSQQNLNGIVWQISHFGLLTSIHISQVLLSLISLSRASLKRFVVVTSGNIFVMSIVLSSYY